MAEPPVAMTWWAQEKCPLAFLDEQICVDESIAELLGEHDAKGALTRTGHANERDVVVCLNGHR